MTFRRVPKSGELIFFLLTTTLWAAPQQINITSTNKATGTFPHSAPYSTIATWHVDWRATVTSGNTTSPAWSGFSSQQAWVLNAVFVGYVAFPTLVTGGWSYQIVDYQDGTGFSFTCPTIPFDQDTVLRVQKFSTSFSCEVWTVQGGNYNRGIVNLPSVVPGLAGNIQIGDATHNLGTMAFFRGYSGTVPLNSKPPYGSSGGDLWDYEFNGNLNDSSGHNLNLSRTGTFSYSAAAVYPPACILPPQTTFRAGTPVTSLTAANSYPLDGGSTLTYNWQQLPSNLTGLTSSTLQFSSHVSANPTIQGLVAGSYTVKLTVTDGSGQQSTCSTKYGAVATDDNGSVIITNPIHAQILGPMIAAFASPWAAEPQQHIAYGNLMIQKLAGTSPFQFQFVDYWNQAQPGTVTVTNGSTSVVGVGTSFTTLFCQGPSNPNVPKTAGNTTIVIWYPILSAFGLPTGTTGRRMGVVQSCTDDTHLTATFTTYGPSYNWVTDLNIGDGSGLSYAYVEQNSTGPYGIGGWQNGGYPANYYDNVKAFYALYYRTGIDDYLVAARTLADRWWSYPGIDKGIPYETSTFGNAWGLVLVPNRSMSLGGLYLRNADNPPYDYGPGLRSIVNYLTGKGTPIGSTANQCAIGTVLTTCGLDVRESGYALGWTALDWLVNSGPNGVSPNSTQAALELTALSNDMTNRWGVCQAGGGVCANTDNLFSLYASWNTGGTNFSASVTNGSPIVTANSGTFNPANFTACATPCSAAAPPNGIWITSTGTAAPTLNSQGDASFYYVVYHSPTQLYLTDVTGQTTVNYTGTTKSAAGWQTITYAQVTSANFLGLFWQPYMTGILNQAYWYVSLALAGSDPANAANAALWARNNMNAVAATGLNTSVQSGFVTNGPYYAIGINCAGVGPGPTYPSSLCDSGLLGDRELNSELLNVATIALRFFPNSTTALTLGNVMAAAMFAQPGEEGFDGTNVLGDLVNPGFFYTANSQHKWFGAFWGVGSDWSWVATRLGALRPPILRVIQQSVDFRSASKAVLTLLSPDGTTSQITCTSSPCPITVDAREGDHVVSSITYLDPGGQVLFSARQSQVLKVQPF